MGGFLHQEVVKNGRVSQDLIIFADDVLVSEVMASLNKFIDLLDGNELGKASSKAREIIDR